MSHLEVNSKYLKLLKNKIDPERAPFSDRGSRLLLYKAPKNDTLFLKLAERLEDLQPCLEDHRNRPPYLPSLNFVDETGNPLSFQLTSYPHALFFQTRIGVFSIAFYKEDTIAVGVPKNVECGIKIAISPSLHDQTKLGGTLKERRNLAYATNGSILTNNLSHKNGLQILEFLIESKEDDAIYLNIRSDVDVHTQLAPFSETLKRAEEKWHNWFSSVPEISNIYREQYYYAWWILGNNLVSPRGHLKREAMMPSKAQYYGIWNWDACFHAIALRHVDIELARDQLRAILDWQLPDGMLPDVVHAEGVVDWIDHPIPGQVTKPPVMAWAALKLHETDPDTDFLEEIYPALKRWNGWWLLTEDKGTGLPHYNHPFSSGADDNPLWDHGMPVLSPDLSTYLFKQTKALSTIAKKIGMPREAEIWETRAAGIVERLQTELYDSKAGLFQAKHKSEVIPEVTLFNLYPLWTAYLNADIESQLLDHLTNPEEFWASHPLSTVARNTPSYEPETMWRGPVWVNTNYIFIEALEQIGYHTLAKKLRSETLEFLRESNDFYEYYNPETGAPPEKAAPIFGWSAALFIDMVIKTTPDLAL
ncbi:MAG: trehalase family glycosidase [Chloroflexota bacterium]|nr:trehalase family glycosidase [Chloroflexota bacterium]